MKRRQWQELTENVRSCPRVGGTKYAGMVWTYGNTEAWGRDTAGVEPFTKKEHLKLEPGRPVLSKEGEKREDTDACRCMMLVVRQ